MVPRLRTVVMGWRPVTAQIHMWKPNPQRQVSGGWGPRDGVSALTKETPGSSPALPPREDSARRRPAGSRSSPGRICCHLHLGLPAPRTVRSKCLWFLSSPVCGTVFWQPEPTKAPIQPARRARGRGRDHSPCLSNGDTAHSFVRSFSRCLHESLRVHFLHQEELVVRGWLWSHMTLSLVSARPSPPASGPWGQGSHWWLGRGPSASVGVLPVGAGVSFSLQNVCASRKLETEGRGFREVHFCSS